MKKSEEIVNAAPEYLECERRRVFFLLMFVGGFYGAFTYSIRGGVFCNAQTANFVLLAMALGKGQWLQALYYFIPMTAYLLGAVVSEAVPSKIKRTGLIRWDTLLILIEMAAVIFLGFLPETAPFQISQVAINFICSMQYNTFRQAKGEVMATTFCTNHLRQTGVAIVRIFKNRGSNRQDINRMLSHLFMLVVFVAGGVFSTVLCNLFLGKAIWGALIPLAIVFADLLYADRKKEHNFIEQTPRGH